MTNVFLLRCGMVGQGFRLISERQDTGVVLMPIQPCATILGPDGMCFFFWPPILLFFFLVFLFVTHFVVLYIGFENLGYLGNFFVGGG